MLASFTHINNFQRLNLSLKRTTIFASPLHCTYSTSKIPQHSISRCTDILRSCTNGMFRRITANKLESGNRISDLLKTTLRLLKREYTSAITEPSRRFENLNVHDTSGSDFQEALSRFSANPDSPGASILISSYSKQANLEKAFHIFNTLTTTGKRPPTVFVFSSLIAACLNNNEPQRACELYNEMEKYSVPINYVCLKVLLRAASKTGDTKIAKNLLTKISDSNMPVNAKDLTQLIQAFVKGSGWKEALEVFSIIEKLGVSADAIMYTCLATACSGLRDIDAAKRIYKHIRNSAVTISVQLATALIQMFSDCGSIEDAESVYAKAKQTNSSAVAVYNAMITAYNEHDLPQKAIDIFRHMRKHLQPDVITFTCILKSCADTMDLELGKEIHAELTSKNIAHSVELQTALLNMFAKCEDLETATQLFTDMRSHGVNNPFIWTVMITALVHCKNIQRALLLFNEMRNGLKPTIKTYTSLIRGCVELQNGKGALKLFECMLQDNVEPNDIIYSSLLKYCADSTDILSAERIYQHFCNSKLKELDVVHCAMLNVYTKTRRLDKAETLFTLVKPSDRNAFWWNTMLNGYAIAGMGERAIKLFKEMLPLQHPDEVTFIALLTACSHAQLVKEALQYYSDMSNTFGIVPSIAAKNCVVDALARVGRFDEAETFIAEHISTPDIVTWMSVLGAFRSHREVERAERIADKAFALDRHNSSIYILLSNLYSRAGMWDQREWIRKEMDRLGIKKVPGETSYELNGKLYRVRCGDPISEEAEAELQSLVKEMRTAGYIPDTTWVTKPVHDDEEKEDLLCRHSEKLALATLLVNTPALEPLYLYKNLRACDDCHSATKFISKLRNRTIIMRDASRFHVIQNGVCDCKDHS